MNNTLYFATFNPNSPAQQDEEIGEVCIANISPKERQKRMRFGIVQFTVTLIVLAVLIALDVNPLWRFLLYFMFSAAAAGYFQARDKT